MRKTLLSLLGWLAIASAAHAAPPLATGQIVVTGFPDSASPGPCADRLCTVGAALTTLAPISAPLPLPGRDVLDIAIENPSSIVVLVRTGTDPDVFSNGVDDDGDGHTD